jgi:hypothetical protein
LDLGQVGDFTALAVVERKELPGDTPESKKVRQYTVRHLQRWQLGSPYTVIVDGVADLMTRDELSGSPLVIDATGVGRAVTDMIRAKRMRAKLVPVTITSVSVATPADMGGWNVPKKDLATLLQTLAQTRPARLQVVPTLPDAAVVAREMQAFKVKVTAAGNETFESWRERDHDDYVLSVAVACWYGERAMRTVRIW